MQVGIHLPSNTDFAASLDDVRAYERAGADMVWLGESYGYDAVSALGALAATTTTIRLGLGIAPLQTRSPALLAMTAAGIDALSGGRAVLGLGASGPQVIEGWHDVGFGAPVARTQAVIERCRAIWRSEPVASERRQVDGSPYRPLKLIHPPPRPSIPIFVGAIGDRSVAQTAALADGWLTVFFWPERAGEVWGAALASGTAERAGHLPPLAIAASAPLAIDRGTVPARHAHRARLAHYIGGMGTARVNFYTRLAIRYGFGDVAERIRRFYLAGDREAAARLLPDDFVDQTCLIGDAEAVGARLDAYRRAGVTIVNVSPHGDSLPDRVAQLHRLRKVLPPR